MSLRAVLLAGAVLGVCVLLWLSRPSGAPPAAEGPMDEAAPVSVEPPKEDELVEIEAAPAVSEARVDGLKAERVVQTGENTWLLRFACSLKDVATPLPRRLDVAVEGPELAFQGVAKRRKNEDTFAFTVNAAANALEGATLYAASTKRALAHRTQAPFLWQEKFRHYRLGQASLASAKWDREQHAVGVPHFELLPARFIGNVLFGVNTKGVKELVIWTQPDPSQINTLPWDVGRGGNKVPFAAFVAGGVWGAGDRPPELDDQWLPMTKGVPVGADVYVHGPSGELELTLNLVSLPDARSVLIREAATGVPSALTMAELNERAAVLGHGVTTISGKVKGRGLNKELALGKTTLPSGEYAVEAWSEPDSAGLMYLVVSKNVTLTVGTKKLTLR